MADVPGRPSVAQRGDLPARRRWWPPLPPAIVGSGACQPRSYARSFRLGQPPPTLAEYYRGGLQLVVEPGTTFTYTDHGFATLGQIVEDVSGKPLDRYFREHIFEPLGMADTDLVRSELVRSHLATGYDLRSGGPKAVTDRRWVTTAASSIYSTPRDMARYLAALLGGGANQHGSKLKPETLSTMFEPHSSLIPGYQVWGWGSSGSTSAGISLSSTRGYFPASTRRSSWLPTTASG